MPSIFRPDHPQYELHKPRRGEVRWMLGRNIWTGVLGNIGLVYMTGGVFFVAYCHEMGMEKYHFGVLRTLSSLMVLLMLLAPAMEEHFRGRKYPWFILQMAARVLLVPLALGLFMRVHPWVIVGLITLYVALASMGTALWRSWTWDYIPLSVYARFAARRMFWMKLTGTVCLLGIAWLVGRTSVESVERRQLLSGIFILLLVLGITDLLFHVRIPEPPRKAPPSRTLSKFVEVFKNEPLRNWLLVMGIWHFAISLGGPFCTPYMMKELGFGKTLFVASLLTGVVPAVGSLATLRFWGRLLDTRHTGLIVAVCCTVWSFIPFFFYCATPENALWMMLSVWLIAGVFAATVTLAYPIITARLSGLEKTMPAVLIMIVMSMGSAVGSAIGTVILHTFSVQHAFMASFVARLTAAFVMFLLLVWRPARTR